MSARITLQARIEQYLAERRRLGFELDSMGHALASFARHVTQVGHRGPLTVDLMAAWARLATAGHRDRATSARRLRLLRPFTRWLRQFEPATQVPDEAIFGSIPGRGPPHIYREPELVELLAAAHDLGPPDSLRAAVTQTLFGLIACTGLRISEALGLRMADVDLKSGTLTIRRSKFGKSRLVPLHPSAVAALARYRNQRARHVQSAPETPFFIATRGRLLGQPLGERQVHRIFEQLRGKLGWIDRGTHGAPRIHDMRHSFAALVQSFFTEHLIQQRAMSPRTVATYRDAFVLFLDFAMGRLHKQPTAIRLEEITPALILAFLDHLEHERGNQIRSRNARLAALRAFLKFAGHRDISALHVVEQALGVPMQRFERPMLGYLSREEVLAVIGKPDAGWTSQRDHLLLTLLYNTGARVSEITGVCVADVVLDGAACVHLHGKGRKQRTVPLWRSTVKAIRAWLRVNSGLTATSALLPNRDGRAMTRTNVTKRLALAVKAASQTHPSLINRRISAHTVRHTTAMSLLQAGERVEVIALWLGHESPTTTHQYVEADIAMKQKALAKLQDPNTAPRRFRAPDSLIEFLKTL